MLAHVAEHHDRPVGAKHILDPGADRRADFALHRHDRHRAQLCHDHLVVDAGRGVVNTVVVAVQELPVGLVNQVSVVGTDHLSGRRRKRDALVVVPQQHPDPVGTAMLVGVVDEPDVDRKLLGQRQRLVARDRWRQRQAHHLDAAGDRTGHVLERPARDTGHRLGQLVPQFARASFEQPVVGLGPGVARRRDPRLPVRRLPRELVATRSVGVHRQHAGERRFDLLHRVPRVTRIDHRA